MTSCFLTAIPFLAGALSMVFWGWNSDRTKERKWHLLIANLVGSSGFVAAGFKPESLPVALLGITIASVGVHATFGPFWALKTSLLAPGVAAVGIALINSIGNLGGFLGPSITGFLKQQTGSLSWGLILYGGTSLSAAVMALFLKRPAEVTTRQ
jgi:ACS family tartrate transporter-like MFS transporter